MIIRASTVFIVVAILFACESNLTDDPIPFATFSDVIVELLLPDYTALKTDGGHKDISDLGAGVRGIILYRNSSSSYFAFEKNCSYRPNEACATVEAHSSGLFMIDPCCSSSFSFSDGMPSGGPAWRPLRQYRTQLSGSVLTITDEIIN